MVRNGTVRCHGAVVHLPHFGGRSWYRSRIEDKWHLGSRPDALSDLPAGVGDRILYR